MSITKNTKVPKRPPRVTIRRSFIYLFIFNIEDYRRDLGVVPWDLVYLEDDLDDAVDYFTKLLTEVVDHHAPLRKSTIKVKSSPWIDQQLREAMSQRDEAKTVASRSNLLSDIMLYRKCRNFVKLNPKKKILILYKNTFDECKK